MAAFLRLKVTAECVMRKDNNASWMRLCLLWLRRAGTDGLLKHLVQFFCNAGGQSLTLISQFRLLVPKLGLLIAQPGLLVANF